MPSKGRSVRKTKKYFKTGKGKRFVPYLKRPLNEMVKIFRAQKKRKKNPIPRGMALAFSTKAAARSYAKKNGLKGYRILKATNPAKRYEYHITSAVGRVGPFSTRASAQAYLKRIKQSGSVPAGLKIVKTKAQ